MSHPVYIDCAREMTFARAVLQALLIKEAPDETRRTREELASSSILKLIFVEGRRVLCRCCDKVIIKVKSKLCIMGEVKVGWLI